MRSVDTIPISNTKNVEYWLNKGIYAVQILHPEIVETFCLGKCGVALMMTKRKAIYSVSEVSTQSLCNASYN